MDVNSFVLSGSYLGWIQTVISLFLKQQWQYQFRSFSSGSAALHLLCVCIVQGLDRDVDRWLLGSSFCFFPFKALPHSLHYHGFIGFKARKKIFFHQHLPSSLPTPPCTLYQLHVVSTKSCKYGNLLFRV